MLLGCRPSPFCFLGGASVYLLLSTYNPYIPWDTSIFERAILMLRNQIGVAFNVGFWIFAIITCILIVIKLVGSFGQ